MKKIVYVTGKNAELRKHPAIEVLEGLGYNVELSNEVTDEPKIERCEIMGDDSFGGLHYKRAIEVPRSLSGAIEDPDFAGFEYASGFISNNPWSRSVENEHCIEHTKRTFDEHAKYVLFRL